MENDPYFDELFQELIEAGAVVDTGNVTLDGDIIYKFNLEILKKIKPDMYEVMVEELDQDLMKLYKQGLIDIDYNEKLEATFQINEAGKHYMLTGELPENIDR
jgi:Tfp pilus assembly ATPase PilU